jgi:uncharacterized Zn finger protein (UPF0148 family)
MTFKNLLREIDRLKRESISIPIRADERGYLDRECPADACLLAFKVSIDDWEKLFRDEEVFCPFCRHGAPSNQWWTTEQVEQSQAQARAVISATIGNALHRDARAFNATAPRGFISMSMKASGSANRSTAIVPVAAAEVLEQEIACVKCNARYAVLGPAFFCPCCGDNSVERMFDAAVAKVRTKVESIETVRQAVREALDADRAEALCRSTIEGGLQDCVVAFQHLAERLYVVPAGSKPPPTNVFQRLDEGSQLWKASVGKCYDDWLTAAELADLKLLFQRRHLLAHREGLVDDKYVQKSGDTAYRAGQRIVVSVVDVQRMVLLVEKLGRALRQERCVPPTEAGG